ncbi:DeoR family transcriptional regulator [Patescibacteria group bacterium]
MNNQQLAFIGDRIQKITEAVYRVTDLLPNEEPLKWAIRKNAVGVFTNLISLKDRSITCFGETERLISKITVLLSVFSKINTVSSINFEILMEEYESIRKTMTREEQREDFVKLLLADKARLPEPIEPNRHTNGQSIGQPKISNKIKVNKNKARKNKIFDVIKNKKEVSVGELSSIFTNCSEKTIQRDLLEMVSRGLLKKEGDKRWRKYILIS